MSFRRLFPKAVICLSLWSWAALPAHAEPAAEAAPATPPIRAVKASDIFVPAELGYVMDAYEPSAPAATPPLIIHVQEAHANYEGQQHLIGILEALVQQHGLKLILVEGGEGDVGLAYLRQYGPPDNRKEVAAKYLQTGVISAEEYLDIVSDVPLILWGVERQELYDHNVEAFLAAEPLQASLAPVLADARRAAEQRAPRVLDPRLNELDAKAKAFEERRLSLAGYVEALAQWAQQQSVPLAGYPQVERFASVRALEGQVDIAKVQQEQQQLISRLSAAAAEADLNTLIAKAEELKAGTIQPVAFYTLLEQLASKTQLDLAQTPQLAAYIRYIQESEQVVPADLSTELDALADVLRGRLAATPESRQLSQLFKELLLIERLVALQLSPEEYATVSGWNLQELVDRWRATLPEAGGLEALVAAAPSLHRFYAVAAERDTVLVQNAVAKLRATQEPLAVLITGGFHAPRILEQLKAEGVAVVTVVPKITQATNDDAYRAVLKYKSGQGSYDDVVAAAGQTTAIQSP